MELHRITSVEEFLSFAPYVFALINNDKRGKWEQAPGDSFLYRFFEDFDKRLYFGEIKNNKLNYFCAIVPIDGSSVTAWIFYVDLDLYEQTTEIINLVKSELRERGYKHIYFTTSRLRSSYKRWAEKHGAKQVSITYRADI